MRVIDFMVMKNGDYHDKQIEYNMTGLLAEIKLAFPDDQNPDLTSPKYAQIVKDMPFAPLIAGGLAEAFGIEKEFLTLELWRDMSNGYLPAKSLPKDSILKAKVIETPRGLLVPLNKNPTPIDETGTYRPDLAGKDKRIGTEFVFGFGQNTSNVITAKAIADPEIEKVFADKMNDIFENVIIPEMEKDAYVRMGADGKDIGYVSKLLVVAFQHIENRSTEPFRHFHFDVMNTAMGEDDELYSMMNDLICQNKEKYTALFQCASKSWMEQEWGLSFKPVYLDEDRDNEHLKDHERNITSWDVDDRFVPQSLRDHLGARNKEMDALMREQGVHGFLAEEIARKESRQEKTELSPSELKAEWADLYAKHGFSARSIAQHEDLSQVYIPDALLPTAELLISNFMRKHKDVSFTEDQFTAHVIKQLLGTTTPERAARYAEEIFEAEAVQMIANEQVPYFQDFMDDTITDPMERQQKQIRFGRDVRFTTKSTLEMEKYSVESLKARQTETGFQLPKAEIVQAILEFEQSQSKPGKKPFQFAIGQKTAIVQAMCEPGAVMNIAGRAGSGKSTLLKVVVEQYEKAGYNVWGTSTSSTATKGLAESTALKDGQFFNSAELFIRLQTGKIQLSNKSVLMVDEAGMASTEEFFKLTKAVNEAGAKLILVGEREQLQAVGFGGLYGTLNDKFLTAPVRDINRQKDGWQREMVHAFAEGNAKKAMRDLYDNGRVIIKKSDKGRMAQLVHDYTKDENDFKEKLIIAATNMDVERINREIRAELKKNGKLPQEEITLTGKDGIDRKFSEGDRIIITKNQKTDDVKQVKLSNSETGKIIGIGRLSNGKPNSLKVEMDNGKIHFINVNKEHSMKHGYASTVHKSQGQTKNNAYYWVSPSLNNLHQAYVACSRHRHVLKMYLSEDMVQTLAQKMEGKPPSKNMLSTALGVAKKKGLDFPPEVQKSFVDTKAFLDKHLPPKEGKHASHVLDDFQDIAEAMSQTQFKKTTYDYSVQDGKQAYKTHKEWREQKHALRNEPKQVQPNQARTAGVFAYKLKPEAPKESLNEIKHANDITTLKFDEPKQTRAIRPKIEKSQGRTL